MQVSIKLIGHLVDLVPQSGPLGPRPRGVTTLTLADDADLPTLLRHVGLPPDLEYFAMINEEHVPATALASRALAAGDAIVLLPPLKGG